MVIAAHATRHLLIAMLVQYKPILGVRLVINRMIAPQPPSRDRIISQGYSGPTLSEERFFPGRTHGIIHDIIFLLSAFIGAGVMVLLHRPHGETLLHAGPWYVVLYLFALGF